MKNLWKKLCTCSLAVTCGMSVMGCNKGNDGNVSKDLNGDGVVSSWETVFESEGSSNRLIAASEITTISSLDELLDINNNADGKTKRTYKLLNNIDCGGKEIAINLDGSEFFGNNKVISNFKLGKAKFLGKPVEGQERVEITGAPDTNTLFYNGLGVYDLNVFMGNQIYELSDTITSSIYSPFVNTPVLDNIDVKGNISIVKNGVAEQGNQNELKASLMYSCAKISSDDVSYAETTTIKDCSVDGIVSLKDMSRSLNSYIGGIASVLNKNSIIYDSYASVDMYGVSNCIMNMGGLVGKNNGFISTCVTTGNINFSYWGDVSKENIGGVVGINTEFAEVKNCSTNMIISLDVAQDSEPNYSAPINLGGVVGVNQSGVLTYIQNDAVINIDNPHKKLKFIVGGLCGTNVKGSLQNIICRGSINATKAGYIYLASLCGQSVRGDVHSAIIVTNINIDNYEIENSVVKLGMLTIFENFNNDGETSDGYTANDSPYLKGILIGGKENVLLGKGANFEYSLGIRNSYKYNTGEVDYVEDGDEMVEVPIYAEKFPVIMDNIFVLGSHALKSNYDETIPAYYTSNELKDINFAKCSKIQLKPDFASSQFKDHSLFIMKNLGFKPFLNHNELTAGEGNIFNTLSFNLPSQNHLVGFYEEKSYNGELAYYDRLFEEYYQHVGDVANGCASDTQDELFSFFHYVLGQTTNDDYSMKLANSFLNLDLEAEGANNLTAFKDIVLNALKCMGVNISNAEWITNSGASIGVDSGIDIIGLEEGVRYLKFVVSAPELENSKKWTFDISDFQSLNDTGDYDLTKLLIKEYYGVKLLVSSV